MSSNPFDEIRKGREKRQHGQGDVDKYQHSQYDQALAQLRQPFLDAQHTADQNSEMVKGVLTQIRDALFRDCQCNIESQAHDDISRVIKMDLKTTNPFTGRLSIPVTTWQLDQEQCNKAAVNAFDDGIRLSTVVTVTLEMDREKRLRFRCERHDQTPRDQQEHFCGLSEKELTNCLLNLFRG